MTYPVAAAPYLGGSIPSPAYAGTFIPQIWSGKLIEKFYDATVLAAIANTDYEGEIKNQGDTVKIRTKPSISINNYEAGQSLAVQRPSSNIVELLINKGKYFNTILDDVMEVQADLNQLSMWADDASEQMKIVIDSDVLDNMSVDLLAMDTAGQNSGLFAGRISGDGATFGINLGEAGTPCQLVKSGGDDTTTFDVTDYIVNMGTVLDEQNIPETGRWMIIPAWMAGMIKKSELKDASISGDGASILRNGRIGMIDRFTLYSSNLLPSAGGETEVFAGHSHGLTFASQLTNVETLRAESSFGTLLRGLQVFGWKIVDFRSIALGVVTKG